jgi:hypothetical protein
LVACKKSDSPAETPVTKNAKFSLDISGTTSSGTEFLDHSFITTNDEVLAIPYAEIHIAGANGMIDVLITNPTVKQYNIDGTSTEGAVVLSTNGIVYEATSTSVLSITEATSSKISGTVSGAFKNVNTGATVQVTNGSFSAQF